MAGFEVVLSDLDSMTRTFSNEVAVYQGVRAKLNPPIADSGDGTLNSIISSVLEVLNYLHGKMAESIDEHAARLRAAREAYAKNELDVHGLFNDLMPEEW